MLTLKKKLVEVQEKLAKVTSDATNLRALVKVLSRSLDFAKETPGNPEEMAKLTFDLHSAKGDAENWKTRFLALQKKFDALDAAAAKKALEITNSQGIPPLSCKPNAAPASTDSSDLVAQLEQLKDPNKQREFWVAHREELSKLLFNR